jgi:hypothetical protein
LELQEEGSVVRRLLVAAVLGTAVVVLSSVAVSGQSAAQTPPGAAGAGPGIFANFVLSVPSAGCSSAGATKCVIPAGSQFTVVLELGDFSMGTTGLGYSEFRGQLNFSPASDALPVKNRPDVTEIVWLDCSTGAFEIKDTAVYTAQCEGSSTFFGEMLQVDYNCTPASPFSRQLTLDGTFIALRSQFGDIVVPATEGAFLDINCVAPPLVGGTQADLAGAASDSNATAAIAGASAAAIVVLGLAVWANRRRVW